jgi:hypothetical protein
MTQTRVDWVLRTLYQAAWAPLLVFVLFVIASQAFDAYLRFPALDMPTHFAGGAVMAFFMRRASANAETVLGEIPTSIHCALALWGTALVAVLWECYEYLSDRLLGTHMVHGIGDTALDLVLGMAGAAIVLMLRDVFGVKIHAPIKPHPAFEDA